MIDKAAGPCADSGRHRWGKEQPHFRGVITTQNKQPCLDCARVRVIEYTRRGNHIAGYFTKTEKR